MDKNDSGTDVANVQGILAQLGYPILSSEVIFQTFGDSTEKVVIEFQVSHSLTPDGVVGPNTLNALKAAVSLKVTVTPSVSYNDYIALLISAGIAPTLANSWGFGLHAAMTDKGIISNKNEVCSLTANVLHETGQLTTFSENLNYSSTALLKLWPTHFTAATASQYGRTDSHPANQKMIANFAYADRMGNGDPHTGDGWLYRGQGPFQLTGSANYKAFSDYSGVDVVADPSKLTQVVVGAKSAIWFWISNKCGPLARALDHKGVCKKINGGENGLAHRTSLTEFFLSKT